MTDRIVLGHIIGVHGIKGDVVVKPYTEDPEALGAYGPLSDEQGRANYQVESLRLTPKGVIVRFAGIGDRTAAERLKGIALTVLRTVLPPPDADQFYHADLIGMSAIAPDGAPIGRVVAVQNFGAGDLLELKINGQRDTAFVPFTDPCVPSVDVGARTLVVVMPAVVEARGDEANEDTDEAHGDDGSSRDERRS